MIDNYRHISAHTKCYEIYKYQLSVTLKN